MKRIAVFCGSNTGKQLIYTKTALSLAEELLKHQLALVYGGANVGLMAEIANHMLSAKAEVIGVIPQTLVAIEVAHKGLSKLHVVNSMHERKKLMFDLSDGFILIPGGSGSLDEFFEILTWYQLGLHEKPLGIINPNGYFNHLIAFLDHAVSEGFIKSAYRDFILIEDNAELLLQRFNRLHQAA